MNANLNVTAYIQREMGEAAQPADTEVAKKAESSPLPTQALDKSSTSFFEPGKSLSITDIVNVGGQI